jgi:hypothetical protein
MLEIGNRKIDPCTPSSKWELEILDEIYDHYQLQNIPL